MPARLAVTHIHEIINDLASESVMSAKNEEEGPTTARRWRNGARPSALRPSRDGVGWQPRLPPLRRRMPQRPLSRRPRRPRARSRPWRLPRRRRRRPLPRPNSPPSPRRRTWRMPKLNPRWPTWTRPRATPPTTTRAPAPLGATSRRADGQSLAGARTGAWPSRGPSSGDPTRVAVGASLGVDVDKFRQGHVGLATTRRWGLSIAGGPRPGDGLLFLNAPRPADSMLGRA